MEEIVEVKKLLLQNDIQGALAIVEELEEMAKNHITNGIEQCAEVLLEHLIKRFIEKRTTKSWDIRIAVSALEIKRRNRKLNRIDNYLSQSELREALEEVFGGVLSEDQIDALVDRDALIQQALDMIITSAS